MKLYKLTNKDLTTRGGMVWGEGVSHELPPKTNPKLCSTDVIHVYETLEVAAFMRHIHGYDGQEVICFEAEGEVVVKDHTKCGVFNLTTIKQVTLPTPTLKQTTLFALLCVKSVYVNKDIDAAIEAAKAGDYRAAAYAAYAAAWAAAAWAAADAANAANAADAAADAANAADAAADAADAADAAADAADAADAAACAAAYANARAANTAANINLKQIALEAFSYE